MTEQNVRSDRINSIETNKTLEFIEFGCTIIPNNCLQKSARVLKSTELDILKYGKSEQ